MSIIQGTAKATAGDASFYNFPIDQSLRFDGSSYLSKIFSSGQTSADFTISMWIKLSALGTDRCLFSSAYDSQYRDNLEFKSSDKIDYYILHDGAAGEIISTAVFRDTSAWYHIVMSSDDAYTRIIYVNGVNVSSGTMNNKNSSTNNGNRNHAIGAFYPGGSTEHTTGTPTNYFNGYMANIDFIDGQALDQYFFGEFKNGLWIPYNAFSTAGSGTATASDGDTATDSYGNNGFRLTFSNASDLGEDSSGNNNDWTVN